jgi:hypothetical protein
MKPEDDPEARIRELERSLAETARASEARDTQTPGGYAYPPGQAVPRPLPPPGYGGTLGGTFPRSPSPFRLWWIFAVVPVIGLIASGAITFYTAHQVSRGGQVILSPTPSIGPTSAAPSARGTSGPIPSAGAKVSVSGIKENRTIACNDSVISVSGISNKVVITGHCASLTVSGVQNSITVDAVDTIEASGFNNQVTYHTGSPTIDRSGEQNVVQHG